jgi:hypothetical protein
MHKKESITHELFLSALAVISRGTLNNKAVSDLLGISSSTFATYLRQATRWSGDNWIKYMLAIGAITYHKGRLEMSLEVPSEMREEFRRIAKADKAQLFTRQKRKRMRMKLEPNWKEDAYGPG